MCTFYNIQIYFVKLHIQQSLHAFELTSGSAILQVVALCQAPFLLDDPNVGMLFPADAIARAKHYLAMAPGGLGIHTDLTVCVSSRCRKKHKHMAFKLLHFAAQLFMIYVL